MNKADSSAHEAMSDLIVCKTANMRGAASGAIVPTAWLFLNPMVQFNAEELGSSSSSVSEMVDAAMKSFNGVEMSMKNAIVSTAGVFVFGVFIGAGKFLFDW